LRERSGGGGGGGGARMIRRNQRMRREYLYTKSLEGTERALFEKKRRIRQALEEGKPIPTELRNEEHELRRQIDLEDQQFQTFWKKRISSSCKMPISSLFFFLLKRVEACMHS